MVEQELCHSSRRFQRKILWPWPWPYQRSERPKLMLMSGIKREFQSPWPISNFSGYKKYTSASLRTGWSFLFGEIYHGDGGGGGKDQSFINRVSTKKSVFHRWQYNTTPFTSRIYNITNIIIKMMHNHHHNVNLHLHSLHLDPPGSCRLIKYSLDSKVKTKFLPRCKIIVRNLRRFSNPNWGLCEC